MGYDMRAVSPMTADEQATLDAARRRFQAAMEMRNGIGRGSPDYEAAQRYVETTAAILDRADVTYFRLNVWGMTSVRRVLYAAGAVHAHGAHPPWPEVSRDEAGEETAELVETLAYAPEVPGVPLWKFGTNDGWIVTPVECRGAAEKWRENRDEALTAVVDEAEDEAGARALLELCDRFVAWMEAMAERGGFRVR